MKHRTFTALLHRLPLILLLAWLPAAKAQLPEPVIQAMTANGIGPEGLGAIVLRGKQVLLAHEAQRSMHPGSTMKLVTTMAALDRLGPIFRARTELRTTAEVADGTLKGDLIVRGGADGDLTVDTMRDMLQTLRSTGIKKIEGNIILDRELFKPARSDLGLPPFDEAPEFPYNVIPDSLLINTNLVQVELRATSIGLQTVMLPEMDGVSLTSNMRLINAECSKWEDGWKIPVVQRSAGGKIKVQLHGTFPRNCSKIIWLNVLDRHDFAERFIRTTWRKLGGKWTGEAMPGSTPPGTRVLAEHVARALPETIRDINKLSNNVLARSLFLSMGSLETDVELGSKPLPFTGEDTRLRAEASIRQWLRSYGIDDTGMVLENGSGLSRIERSTPSQMAAVLQIGLGSTWAPEFMASLPIVGLDGTMRNRMRDGPAASRARLKTGTLTGMTGIAGYVPDANNQMCIVVGFINHPLAGNGRGRAVLDALVNWVARSGAEK
jgi:D-alanyl-D-alanine carboxypeptidase/D-alanyl-D-alanine-endopeptidase (penicillin-binding protein 4)